MKHKDFLVWPPEMAASANTDSIWGKAGHNLVLDFHGDPQQAALTLLSDGNHHMALEQALARFVDENDGVDDIFYITLPPAVLLAITQQQGIYLGNMHVTVQPDLLIGPLGFVTAPLFAGKTTQPLAMIQNRGCALLVRKNNPKNIAGVADLLRPDVSLFISNPVNEKVSHVAYKNALLGLAQEQGLDCAALSQRIDHDNGHDNIVYGDTVHHREAPQSLFSGQCDVAIVYYHLALRYTRIFPEEFDLVMLSGTPQQPQGSAANPSTTIYMARIENSNAWSRKLHDFMCTQAVQDIYVHHGLQTVA